MKILNKLVFLAGFSIMGYGATFEVSTTTQLRQAFEDATANGEDDTIILNAGTYKTTDDGFGTFKFSDIEAKNLTIKGKDGISREDIILDGASTHQVLNLTSTNSSTVFNLSGFTVSNGKSTTGGGGIYTNKPMIVDNCKVYANKSSSYYGGAIYGSSVNVSNSTISGNIASYGGGAIYGSSVNVSNSTISGNTASYNGGAIYGSTVNIANSTINGNTASSSSDGGGIYGSTVNISKSIITGNTASSGGGIYGNTIVNIANSTISQNTVYGSYGYGSGIYGATVSYQSIFKDNKYSSTSSYAAGSAIQGYNHKIFNSIFINNSGRSISGKGLFVNNIISGSTIDIDFNGDSKLYNNYLDYTKLINQTNYTIIKKNSIQPSEGNINIDENGTLLENSILIDKGLNSTNETYLSLLNEYGIYNPIMSNGKYKTYPTDTYGSTICNTTCQDMNLTYQLFANNSSDFAGNTRIFGTAIDIGAFEYGATDTKPNISNITPPSTIKVFDSVSFGITASASGDRTIVSTLVDYEGDGAYVDSTVAHKYTNAGTYTAKVKVIDSSSEEKIVEQTIVVNELTREEAIDYGKNICITNPSSCGLGGTTTPNILNTSDISTLSSGQWYLMGTSNEINDLTIFNSASIVWIYEQGTWKVKSPNGTMEQSIANSNYETIQSIKQKQGFWIKK